MAEPYKGGHYVHVYGEDPHRVTNQRRASLVRSDVLGKSVLELSKSVVKIYCYYSAQNFGMPWQKQRQNLSFSSGFVIEFNGRRIILCNAHGVSHFNSVQVRKSGGSKKFSARVLHIAHTCDLAILDVDDKLFWQDIQPLVLGDLPELQSDILVIGYPTGGDTVSFTQGVISRLCVNTYAHSGELYLCVQIDAAINSGNSGGPVLLNDKSNPKNQHTVVGVAFESLNDSDGIGYVIPCCVIRHMLEAWANDRCGTPSLNIVTQSLESQVMRDALHIPPLSAIIEHLYDCTAMGDEIRKSRTCHPSLMQSGSSSSSSRQSPRNRGNNNEMNTSRHSVSGRPTGKWVAGAPTDGGAGGNDGTNNEDMNKGDDDANYDLETEQLLLRRRHSADVNIGDEDEIYEYVQFIPIGDNKVECPRDFTIRKTDRSTSRPPQQLIDYITSSHNDTAVGVKVCRVTPFTKVSEILHEGDVILTIDGTPIASDQTILLRLGERVRFSHLITSKQIGDHVEMIVVRDLSILRVNVPIEDKEYIAKWCQYNPPSYLVALGMVMVPLSSNLMESEHGSRWMQIGEIPLLSLLFTGTLSRFHKDEEVVILTQILSHPCNEGYDYSMRRITHVNGIRVINLQHLSKLVHKFATEFDDEERASRIDVVEEIDEAKIGYDKSSESKVDDNIDDPEFISKPPDICTTRKERYIRFKLENRHEVILDLKNSEKSHLEILERHQIPIPGSSADIQPMYDIETVLLSPRGSITPRPSLRQSLASPGLSSPGFVVPQHKNFMFPSSRSHVEESGFSPPNLNKEHNIHKKPLFEDFKEEDADN